MRLRPQKAAVLPTPLEMPPATLNVSCMLRAAPLRRDAGAGRVAVAPRRAAAGRGSLSVSAAGKSYKITLLPGDGIGPEILKVAVDCLNVVVRARKRRNAAKPSQAGFVALFAGRRAAHAALRSTALGHAAQRCAAHLWRACAWKSQRGRPRQLPRRRRR